MIAPVPSPAEMTFGQYFRDEFEPKWLVRLLPSAAKPWRQTAARFLKFCVRDPIIANIDDELIDKFRVYLQGAGYTRPRMYASWVRKIRDQALSGRELHAMLPAWQLGMIVKPLSPDSLVVDALAACVVEHGMTHPEYAAIVNALPQLSAWLGRAPTLADLAIADCGAWVRWETRRQLSERTARRVRKAVLVLLGCCHKAGVLRRAPAQMWPEKYEPPPDAPSMPAVYDREASAPLLAFYLDLYEPLKLRSRTTNTKRLYHTTIRTFERYLQRRALLSDLNDLTVSRFLDWHRQQGRSPYSVNKERFNLTAIWNYACRRQAPDGRPYVLNYHDVQPLATPQEPPMAWTREDLQKLFTAVANKQGLIGAIPAAKWWRALLLVLWDTGERIGAVMALEWQHVDRATGHLNVPASSRKGGRVGRVYRLHRQTLDALAAIRQSGCKEVFSWPYSHVTLWDHYGALLRSAGLPDGRNSKFHRIRRSVASFIELSGIDASVALGHSSRQLTERSYLDPRIVQRPDPSDVLFRPDADDQAKGGAS